MMVTKRTDNLKCDICHNNFLRRLSFRYWIDGTRISVIFALFVVLAISGSSATDITNSVFGFDTAFIPAAFGDFNADEYTDLIVIRNEDNIVEVLLGSESEPLLQKRNISCKLPGFVGGVAAGDFDGDALLDAAVLVEGSDPGIYNIHLLWGGLTSIECGGPALLRSSGHPLAIDANYDGVADLFGTDTDGKSTVWFLLNRTVTPRPFQPNKTNRPLSTLRVPHSSSFLDLNGDSSAELVLATTKGYEVWEHKGGWFEYNAGAQVPLPPATVIGQSLFLDLDLDGVLDHVVPVCRSNDCIDSAVFVRTNNRWTDLKVSFHDGSDDWGFIPPSSSPRDRLTHALTLRGGDFNMDGYPDAVATLRRGGKNRVFLLENVPGAAAGGRSLKVRWDLLEPSANDTILGVFCDLAHNGLLDLLMVRKATSGAPMTSAFKNNLDYDANFMKVMVVSGRTNAKHNTVPTPLGKTRKLLGTSFPGPLVRYATETPSGWRHAAAAQLPQSAHFALHLPYALFGLGRAPNFIDSLDSCIAGRNKSWLQIIPNSQIVVIPSKMNDTSQWSIQLFVTPSKIIVKTLLAIGGISLFITIILLVLVMKERREDKREKLRQAHRFHFDGM